MTGAENQVGADRAEFAMRKRLGLFVMDWEISACATGSARRCNLLAGDGLSVSRQRARRAISIGRSRRIPTSPYLGLPRTRTPLWRRLEPERTSPPRLRALIGCLPAGTRLSNGPISHTTVRCRWRRKNWFQCWRVRTVLRQGLGCCAMRRRERLDARARRWRRRDFGLPGGSNRRDQASICRSRRRSFR